MEPESTSELEARKQLEHVYGRAVERVAPDDRPTPDYALPTTGSPPGAIEVKEVVSSEWKALSAAIAKQQTWLEVPTLTRHWHVMLEARPVASRLVEVPNFPADNEEEIARFAAAGWVVKRREDRIAEWKHRMAHPAPPVRLKNLITDLVQPLGVLESHGVFTTRGGNIANPDVARALLQISARTGGAICMGHPARPAKGMPAGVNIASGFGSVRTGNPNTLAERAQAWLDSELSANLIESLSRPEYGERHGVLVFDGLEPELQTVNENPAAYQPTDPLVLPSPLTHLWCLVGPVVLRYADDGWQRWDAAVSTC